MKILVDMNLAPAWVEVLVRSGWETVHWSTVGDPRAPDYILMKWARTNGHVVFTHDLDFSALLAASGAEGPSVIQVRAQDILPTHLELLVVSALRQFETQLDRGALVVVEEARTRARLLPLV